MDTLGYTLFTIGIIGFVFTMILYFFRKNKNLSNIINFDNGEISFLNKKMNFFALIYIFIIFMMIIISIISGFYEIIIFALVPILLILFYMSITKKIIS